MSYTRTITSNGNSISQEGGQSFNQQLDDLQEQIEEGGGGSITDLGTSSGTANALAGASLVDTATTFTAGRLYRIRTNAANSGAATCSINGGTGVAMKKSPSSAALASGDIADATELLLYYDGTNLQVLSGLTVSATNITGLTDGAGNSGQSYNYPGGLGDRSASITVTSSVGLFSAGNASGLVNGNIYDTSQYFGAGLNASSHWIKFDFGAARKITEAKWFQSGAASHGTWKWQGSNDDSSYTDVGTSFTLGSVTPQAHTSLTGNTVAYRYWKLVGVSGTTSSSPYINECEFELNDSSAVSATSLSVPGQASFTGTAQFAALPVLPRQIASTFLGAPAGASDAPVFRYVTRADIGSLSLTPSDMPTQYALEAVASSQTLNTSDYKTILYDTPGVNTGPAWSYSSGTWTCLIAGVYDIDAIIYAASSVVVELYVNKNGTRRYGGSAVICSSAPSVRKTISFGSGDTFYIEAYAAGTGPALDVSIVGLRDIFVNRRA